MKELFIALNCLVCLVAFWILIGIVLSIVLVVLSNKIKRKKVGLNIILAQKYDISKALAIELMESGVELDEKVKKAFRLNKSSIDKFSTSERNLIGKRITSIISMLLDLASNETENARVIKLVNSLQDVEKEYRHLIISTNSIVAAYNYWVKFIPYRPISKLFRLKTIRNAE